MTSNKRKFPRVDSQNLTFYSVDADGTVVAQHMGRTLNISQTGICLETDAAIDPNHTLLLTVAMDEDLVELVGKVVYCKTGKAEMYELGVKFVDELSDVD